MPCLRIFLEAASAGRLGHNIVNPTASRLATAGYHNGSYALSSMKRHRRSTKIDDDDDQIQLADEGPGRGETLASAIRGGAEDKISVASDDSRRAIMVRHTVTVEVEEE